MVTPMKTMICVLALIGCGSAQNTSGGGGGGGTGGGTAPVPEQIRTAVSGAIGPNAKIVAEQEHGATIYAAMTTTKLELEFSSSGQLQKTEVAIPVASLPTTVANALRAKGTITEAEAVITPAGTLYEVEVGDGEYTVDEQGKIVEEEHEHDDDKDTD